MKNIYNDMAKTLKNNFGMILVECYDFDTIIEAVVDGAVPSDIWGHIISPHCIAGLKIGGGHIPYFAMGLSNHRHFKDGKITSMAISSMFNDMRNLYETYIFYEEHKEEFLYIYQMIKIAVYIKYFNETKLSDDALHAARRELRRKLKMNELSITDYESDLKKSQIANKKYIHMQFEIDQRFYQYVNSFYGNRCGVKRIIYFVEEYMKTLFK